MLSPYFVNTNNIRSTTAMITTTTTASTNTTTTTHHHLKHNLLTLLSCTYFYLEYNDWNILIYYVKFQWKIADQI